VLVVLPRVPDAAEHLEAVVGELDAALGHERLGRVGQLRAVDRTGADGGGGVGHQALGHLQPQARVGEEVLHRLERADRAPEGDPVLGVGEGHLEVGVHGPDRLGGAQHRHHVAEVRDRDVGGLARSADEVGGGHGHRLQHERRPGSGHVEAVDHRHADTGGVRAHQDQGRPVGAVGVDEGPGAVRQVGHHVDPAVEHEPVTGSDELARRALGERPRGPAAAGDQLAEHAGGPGGAVGGQRRHHRAVAGEGPGLEAGAPLGGEKGGVEDAVARRRAATGGLVGQEAEPPQLGGGAPVGGVVALGTVGTGPHHRQGDLVVHEPDGGLEQHLLLVGGAGQELDGHDRPLSSSGPDEVPAVRSSTISSRCGASPASRWGCGAERRARGATGWAPCSGRGTLGTTPRARRPWWRSRAPPPPRRTPRRR
jgi:hypothetical protein